MRLTSDKFDEKECKEVNVSKYYNESKVKSVTCFRSGHIQAASKRRMQWIEKTSKRSAVVRERLPAGGQRLLAERRVEVQAEAVGFRSPPGEASLVAGVKWGAAARSWY
jgi:hypothetical protein